MIKMEERLYKAYDLLRRLGGTANYKGFSYAAYAMALCAERPERLLLVTKNLYPEVAKQYRTTWRAVERDIRTLITMIWTRNSDLLGLIAGGPLEERLLLRRISCDCGRGSPARRGGSDIGVGQSSGNMGWKLADCLEISEFLFYG